MNGVAYFMNSVQTFLDVLTTFTNSLTLNCGVRQTPLFQDKIVIVGFAKMSNVSRLN